MSDKICNKKDIKNWFILFCMLNLIFSHYYITFFWGNHDWDWVKGTNQVLSITTGMFEGRYAKFILNTLLFGGQILPILNNLIAFALLALGGILLIKYWQIKENAQVFVALMATTAPFILGWLYFPINILGNFSAVALVSGGLILSNKHYIWAKISSVICFLVALGVYPSVAEMMIICFCFNQILNPKTALKDTIKSGSIVLIALFTFKILLLTLSKLGLIVGDYYNLQTVSIYNLITKTPGMLKLACLQLVTPLPFMTLKMKIIGVIIILIALAKSKKTYKNIICWIVAFLATVLSTWLTGMPEETAYMPRVNFYGINFFYVGALSVLITSESKIYRNLGYLLSIVVLWHNIIANMEAQKVWSLGKIAEEQLVTRINSRVILNNENYKRIPVIAGEIALRPRYYHQYYQKQSQYVLNGSLLVRHIPSGMMNFYEVRPIYYGYSGISDLRENMYHFIIDAKRPWPAEESIYIDDNYMLLMLTSDGINAIQAQLPH